jgi:hypothetical protein
MSLRGNLSQDWLKLLEITVDALKAHLLPELDI